MAIDGLINQFFQEKTVQKAYNFVVSFNVGSDGLANLFVESPLGIFNQHGDNFPIKPWHVKSVSLPSFGTKFEEQKVGQFTIRHPMLELDNPLLKISFEEDDMGTIQKFIYWLLKRRMDENGFYYPLEDSKINSIKVELYDPDFVFKTIYTFYDCCLATTTGLELSYAATEATAYDLEFSFQYMEIEDSVKVED